MQQSSIISSNEIYLNNLMCLDVVQSLLIFIIVLIDYKIDLLIIQDNLIRYWFIYKWINR